MTTAASASRLPVTPTKSVRDRIANLEAGSSVQQQSPKSPSTSSRRTSIIGRSNLPRLADKARKLSVSFKTSSGYQELELSASSGKAPSPAPVSSVSSPGATSQTPVESSLENNSPALFSPSNIVDSPSSIEPELTNDLSTVPTAGTHSEQVDSHPYPIASTAPVEITPSPNLDDLFSPNQSTSAAFVKTEAQPEEQPDEEDADNVRFSTVPLSGKSFDDDGNVQISSSTSSSERGGEDLNRPDVPNIISPTTLTFLKNRLEKQEDQHDRSHGTNEQLQVQFTHLQNYTRDMFSETEAETIDWDFWGAVMADYHQFARDNSEELARAIESGIPNSLRGMLWQLMSASKDTSLESEYAKYLKESSVHEKAIARDLGRTFPHHDFFRDGKGIGQENLFNVLKAYSLYDPEVGYCQGLPFVVAVLLLNMPEEEAFCLLVRLMTTYGLRGHFLPEMPALQMRLFQFDRLLEEVLPVLHVHFLRQGVKSSMFCSQWFLTIFSYRFPLDVVFRIYDNVLATGIEAIFGFAIALLKRSEELLLKLKFDDILGYMRNSLFEAYKNEQEGSEASYFVDQFIRDASLIPITPFMLDAYAHEYEDSVREREAHAIEMDNLRNYNRNLSNQIKMLETNLAQLNTEHCEVVKQLVMTRLENENLESELVRYKLLYADLMHQNEDAGSSHRISQKR